MAGNIRKGGGSSRYKESSTAGQQLQPKSKRRVRHTYLGDQGRKKRRHRRLQPTPGVSQREKRYGAEQEQGMQDRSASTLHIEYKAEGDSQQDQCIGGTARYMGRAHHTGIKNAKEGKSRRENAREPKQRWSSPVKCKQHQINKAAGQHEEGKQAGARGHRHE